MASIIRSLIVSHSHCATDIDTLSTRRRADVRVSILSAHTEEREDLSEVSVEERAGL